MKNETPFMETMKVIKQFLVARKVGNVQVNCFRGGVSSINVHETINWDAEEKHKKEKDLT